MDCESISLATLLPQASNCSSSMDSPESPRNDEMVTETSSVDIPDRPWICSAYITLINRSKATDFYQLHVNRTANMPFGTNDTAAVRSKLRAIIQDLSRLAEVYEPPTESAWSREDDFLSKAKALIFTAQTPLEYTMSLILTSLEGSCLQTLLHLNAIQSIPASESISLSALATKTDVEPPLLERLLRLAVASNFIHQNPQDLTYSHSHLSQAFVDPESMSSRAFPFFYDEIAVPMASLPQYLTHQHSQIGKWEEPGASRDSSLYNIATWAAGVEGQKTAYEVMQEDPARMARMQKGMFLAKHINPYLGYYNFDTLAQDTRNDRKILVDVGGGQGQALAAILGAFPTIQPHQCVLQDTEPVIALARSQNPADVPVGVEMVPHDYFKPQPVQGAKAYYLKAVAHNLSDANFVRVLKNIIPVMASDSKLLIAENVLPATGVKSIAAFMDLSMMGIGSKERTEDNFRQVLEKAGLKVDGVYRMGGGSTYAMVEASIK